MLSWELHGLEKQQKKMGKEKKRKQSFSQHSKWDGITQLTALIGRPVNNVRAAFPEMSSGIYLVWGRGRGSGRDKKAEGGRGEEVQQISRWRESSSSHFF